MKSRSTVLFTICVVLAIAQDNREGGSCPDLNQEAMKQTAEGHLAEAEASLGQSACAGHILSYLAKAMFVMGRLHDAERLAEQSIRILEKFYPSNDSVLLRPLQTLAAVWLESGQTTRARDTVTRIQSIPIKRPEDRAIIHGTTGVLLQLEGRRKQAEVEYYDAFRAWEEAGRGESADAASILNCLGSLYLGEQRLNEARNVLDHALAIYDRAGDAAPIDRMKFLALRSVLHARLGEWRQSEQDLCDALSMADRQPSVDPALLRSLLVNYSYVLRKNHHRREARGVEARLAALPADGATAAVVDVADLLGQGHSVK